MARLATLIGGRGFVGRRLQARLQEHGWTCQLPARDEPGLFRRPLGHVFHCAGLTADYAARPFDTVEAHATLLARVLRDADFESLVYLSSTRLYDGCGGFAGAQVDEDTPLALDPAQPRHLYDLSKALGESLCRQASGGRARIARLSCVYGGDDDAGGFLDGLLARLRAPGRGPVMEVDSSAEAGRDYVHLDDVAEALMAIAAGGSRPLYNVAGGATVFNRELFARLGELAGCALRCRREGPVPCPAPVSIERMQREFGWRPRTLLDQLPALLGEALPC